VPSKKTHRPKGAVELVPEIDKTLAKPSVYHDSLPPLQAGHFLNMFQGLKPLAESLGPFGT
jgi:hypothetical protein